MGGVPCAIEGVEWSFCVAGREVRDVVRKVFIHYRGTPEAVPGLEPGYLPLHRTPSLCPIVELDWRRAQDRYSYLSFSSCGTPQPAPGREPAGGKTLILLPLRLFVSRTHLSVDVETRSREKPKGRYVWSSRVSVLELISLSGPGTGCRLRFPIPEIRYLLRNLSVLRR